MTKVKPMTIDNFRGWLNLSQGAFIEDNQFSVATNFFYNKDKQLETRRGIIKLGDTLGSPITSIFWYQRDDTLATVLVCHSGTVFYEYNEWTDIWVSKKTGLTEYETQTGRTGQRTRWDYAVYKNVIYMCNGVDDYASWNWTTYTEYATMPNIRYINQLTDRIFWAGEDLNPSTLYYSDSAPANGNDFDDNQVVIWWDENGRINWLTELGNIILAGKSEKIYSVNVAAPSAAPIDAQQWLYSDRCIANVGNSLVYLGEQGVTTLKQRSWVSGSSALEGTPLDQDVRALTQKIENFQLNANTAWFIKNLNNYYISFDANDNNVPDTTLVYNSLVWAWTQYTYPTTYDYGEYIDSDQNKLTLVTSWGQTYQMETWFQDDGVDIEYELETNRFDLGLPGMTKTWEYVDILGYKSKGFDIQVDAKIDGDVQGGSFITDLMIDDTAVSKSVGIRPIGLDPLNGVEETADVPLYRFVFRLPLFLTWWDISLNMSSTWGVWVMDRMRIGVEQEEIEIFAADQIG